MSDHDWGRAGARWGTGWIWGEGPDESGLPELFLEMMLDGVNWTDVTDDARVTTPIAVQYGIQGSGPADRVATTGTLSFAMDNSEHNSAGLLGYYAPGHANCRDGFEVGCPVRLRIVYGATYYKFIGTLETIDPELGQYRDRVTQCQAVDWMDEAAKQKIRLLATQVDQRGDELIATIVAEMTKQPEATDYAVGDSVFPYSLDNSSTKASPMSVFQRIAMSELGYIFISGGLLTFQARSTRGQQLASAATLDDEMVGLSVIRKRQGVYNRIQVTLHPRRVDTDATTVLFNLTGSPKIEPGKTQTFIGRYRDPDQIALRCGGMDMVDPVATTDYTMHSAMGGGGDDLTANFDVTAHYGGNGVELIITNNGALAGYVTLMQCRGRGVYDDNPIVMEASDSDSREAYGENVLPIDMPLQTEQLTGQDVADFLLAALKDPHDEINGVEFIGNVDPDLMTAGLALGPGHRVTIIETATGVAGDFYINGVQMSIVAGGVYRFGWVVTPIAPFGMWLLGIEGHSELGVTTILGF